ncbi:unnamed protein product, partial [Ectocarpus sp. 12 AP-2014]
SPSAPGHRCHCRFGSAVPPAVMVMCPFASISPPESVIASPPSGSPGSPPLYECKEGLERSPCPSVPAFGSDGEWGVFFLSLSMSPSSRAKGLEKSCSLGGSTSGAAKTPRVR